MENAADALKMAGAVLMFVLALSITILSFGQARETADTILDYKDRETEYIQGGYYYQETGTERTVNLETIIPAIFRAYLENYRIVFIDQKQNPINIYRIKQNNRPDLEKNTLDLETQLTETNAVLASNEQKVEFLRAILYRDFTTNYKTFIKNFTNIELINETLDGSLYNILKKASKITEYLGVYYQDDNPNVPDVMKTEKRVITYKIEL